MTTPLRIGILHDLSAEPQPISIEPWLRLAVDDVTAAGRLEAPVEFVRAFGLGLPSGTAEAIERAYDELAAQDVLMIIGPAIGDNALIATPLTERYRIPTVNWAGAERARGPYMFHLQVGSHEDESVLLAHYLAGQGLKRVGVIFDRSPIGERHFAFLEIEARAVGIEIAASAGISPLAQEAEQQAASVFSQGIDALVYLGLGLSAPAVAEAAQTRGFAGPRLMNTAGIRGYAPEFARRIDGWIYVDMFSDNNQTLSALRARTHTPPEKASLASRGYDLGRLVAEALARAPAFTRDGVKEGLERVKFLPAAEGRDGTLLGFGVWDRGALHGRYLVLRRWLEGRSVEVEAQAGP